MKIIIENVTSYLVDASPKYNARVRARLTTEAPGFRYTMLYKTGRWDGKVRLYDQTSASFPTGLLPLVADEVADKLEAIEDRRAISQLTLGNHSVKLRPYQGEAVDAALNNSLFTSWWPRGVIQMATGGGKTEVAVAMIQMTGVPTLFLVNRNDLVRQARERFAAYGIESGVIEAGTLEIDKQVTVATIQSLMSFQHKTNRKTTVTIRSDEEMAVIYARKEARRQKVQAFLDDIEQVFVDEAHFIAGTTEKGNLFTSALNLMPNAYMRWGLTATPFMREEYHNWLLSGTTGDLLYQIDNRKLIEMGYLAEANMTMYTVPKTEGVPNSWPDCYESGIVLNRRRNKQILQSIMTEPGPVFVLVKSLAHGEILSDLAAKEGLDVPFVQGKSSGDDRSYHLNRFRDGDYKAIIASSIWDTGVDIPEIKTLILAAGGKGKIKNLQSLGRGMRLSEGKDQVNVIDFLDQTTRWLKKHAKERKKIWEGEGFTVTIKELE